MKHKQGWKVNKKEAMVDFSRYLSEFDINGRLIEKKENPITSFFLITLLVVFAINALPALLSKF